ncbi:MAG TPA: ATP-binding protein [Candidatus Obscuribacterales bacterium]
MRDNSSPEEIYRLRAQLAALEELLCVHEQTVREQSDRLENTLKQLRERQQELEALTISLEAARDQALEASRLKSQFLANVSHEIRTPISSVIGMTELLLDTELSATQRHFGHLVLQSAQSLLSIINDILDLSKMEAGKIELSSTEFDLDTLVSEALDLLAPTAQEKDLTLEAEIDPAIPTPVIGDPVRLRQILVNLIGNAVKFTDQGGVTVKAELASRSNQEVVVRTAVKDTGIGLSKAAAEKLFQPFVQADGSTTRKYGGTGLGLSICRHLVDLMGGQIGLDSEEGKGSTFWFDVVLKSGAAHAQRTPTVANAATTPANSGSAPPEEPSSSKDSTSSAGKPLVLIAEDNPALQELAMRQVKKLGCDVAVVGTGREAVEAVASTDCALVLMDCQMPDMDGYAACKAIRKAEENAGRHVPIIAMTAGAMKGDREKCLEAGMDDYLAKPVSLADLKRVLAQWAGIHPPNEGSPISPRGT